MIPYPFLISSFVDYDVILSRFSCPASLVFLPISTSFFEYVNSLLFPLKLRKCELIGDEK